MNRFYLAYFALLLLFAPASNTYTAESSEPLKVRYPSVKHPYFAKRDAYFVNLLAMALERSGEEYELIDVVFSEYSEKRSVLLIQSDHYDVHWINTTADREQELLPIRIPLYKGVIGWRALLIKPEMQATFDQVDSVQDLKRFVFAQGHDWADVEILVENGFAVERSSNWGGLFKMVNLDRAQAFPRSIVEIVAEQKEEVAKDLAIERNLILRYPAAYYFFVAKDNLRLKNAIERGLQNSLQDGSFDRLFFETFGEQISLLNLQQRKILSIDHPNLQNQMPIGNKQLWFSVEWFTQLQQRFTKP